MLDNEENRSHAFHMCYLLSLVVECLFCPFKILSIHFFAKFLSNHGFLAFFPTGAMSKFSYLPSWTFAYIRLLDKPYENEVTLTGQKPSLKCCQHLELLTQLKRGIDLSMLKI